MRPTFNLRRRQTTLGLLGLLTAPTWARLSDQPIKLLVGFPPGGGGDRYGRLIATALQKSMGQTVIVENRAGAGGNIAADLAAKAAPDGHTLLLAMSGNFAVTAGLRPAAVPFKVPDDFVPIGLILESPHGLFVSAASRFRTVQEVLKEAKAGKLSFASTGTGGAAHIGMEMVKHKAGVDILHIPYKGSGPAITDLISGQVDLFFATAAPIMGQVQQGALRLLALTGEARNPAVPAVPTFKEVGVDVVVTQWYGLAAPKGTPAAAVKILSEHLSKVLALPEVRDTIRADAAIERDISGVAFNQYILADIARYRSGLPAELIKQVMQ